MYSFGSTFSSYVEKNKGSEGTIQKYDQRFSYRLQLCLLGSEFFSEIWGTLISEKYWILIVVDTRASGSVLWISELARQFFSDFLHKVR